MGLFWSMRPTRRGADDLGLLSTPIMRVRVRALRGRKVVASAYVVRRSRLETVRIRDTTLAEEGFVGRFYEPQSSRLKPGILVLGGSAGGLPYGPAAALLAARGYPTLALAYFGEPGLPSELREIPLEYFERALQWLARQPGVDGGRLVVHGASRGAEAALLLGSTYPRLVRAVVAYAPSSVVNAGFPGGGPAWTLAGRPLPHVGESEFGNPNPPSYPEAVIAVERISGPIFLVAGNLDLVWPSAPYADAIVRRLRANGRRDVTSLQYDGAGHALAVAAPNLPVANLVPTRAGVVALGGTRKADARARAHAWPRLMRFLANVPNRGSDDVKTTG